jgi:hypothetical protein
VTCVGPHVTRDTHVGLVACGCLEAGLGSELSCAACSSTRSAVWGHVELSLGRRYATVDVPTLQFTQNFHIKTLSVEEVAKEQRNYLFSRPLEILL